MVVRAADGVGGAEWWALAVACLALVVSVMAVVYTRRQAVSAERLLKHEVEARLVVRIRRDPGFYEDARGLNPRRCGRS